MTANAAIKKEARVRNGRFAPGNKPWNKGLKGIHLSPSSQWKKGCEFIPAPAKPVQEGLDL